MLQDATGMRRMNALDAIHGIRQAAEGKRVVLFLDYDGTLSPIVEIPDRAFMSEDMRAAVKDAATQFTTAIVTGRSRQKVFDFVKLDNLIYAGSHGFDIQGPISLPIKCQVAEKFRPVLQTAMTQLQKDLQHIEGVELEDNQFAVSVHYRRADHSKVPEVQAIVDQALATKFSTLTKRFGKKVLELRPHFEWDKGRAVMWILNELGLELPHVLPLYLGDDVSDEDAFTALLQRPDGGIGILVQDPKDDSPRSETNASYTLKDTNEVQHFLKMLCKIGDKARTDTPTQN